MKVLGLIVARGGSKGVPRKNLKDIGSKSLIQWVHAAGLDSGVDRLIISTDDHEILEHAKSIGLEAPFTRPAELSTDASPVIDTIKHSLEHFKKTGVDFDHVVLLQPSSPFITGKIIDEALALIKSGKFDSVISIYEANHFHPRYIYSLDHDGQTAHQVFQMDPATLRQKAEKYYIRCGSLYVFSSKDILEFNSLYGQRIGAVVVEESGAICIDNPMDLAFAKLVYEEVISNE